MSINPKFLVLTGALLTGSVSAQVQMAQTPTQTAQTQPVQTQLAQVEATPTQAASNQTAPGTATAATRELQVPFQADLERNADRTGTASAQAAAQVQRRLVLIQALPAGTSYVPGSSRLDGQPLAEPLQGQRTLYWVIPAQGSGLLTFSVTGSGAVPAPALAWTDGQQGRGLRPISGQVDVRDYLSAERPPSAAQNPGAIKLPLNGSEYRTTDRVTVVIEGPLGRQLDLRVNGAGVPAEQIGTITKDEGNSVQRLEFFGIQLQPGRNVIQLGSEQAEVFLAGKLEQIEAEPVQLVADGSTPLRIRLTAADALGTGVALDYLTVSSNIKPLTPDAAPLVAGYQVALRGGTGLLELKPQTTPQTVSLDIASGERVWQRTLEVQPSRSTVGVGAFSATAGLKTPLQADIEARGYFEGPVGDGKLYVSADKEGLPVTPSTREQSERFTHFGDQSTETVPLQAAGPIAAVYEHPSFRASYRYAELDADVLPLGQKLTAATVTTKTNPQLSAFVASVPRNSVTEQRLELDGTRLLRLGRENIAEGSLSLTLVTTDALSGAEVSRRSLHEGAEWVADTQTGIVTLGRALEPVDAELNRQHVLASYRVTGEAASHQLAYGAQVVVRGGTQVLGQEGQYALGAAAARLDDQTTFGVRGAYQSARILADARVLYAGGVLSEARLNQIGTGNALNLRYQSGSYSGLGRGAAGLNLRGRYEQPLNERWSSVLAAQYVTTPTTEKGYAEALALYRLRPWSAGLGARYSFGDTSGLGLTGSLGYQDRRTTATLKHSQPFTGDVKPETEFGVSYLLAENVVLSARDLYTWGEGHTAAVGLRNRVGLTDYEVAYETGGDGGQTNRARLGVGTTWPLNERTTLGARASYVRDFAQSDNIFNVSADLAYRGEGYRASAGADFKYQDGLSTVVRGAVAGDLTRRLSVSADGTAEFGVRQGAKLGVGYAYRAEQLSSLGYLRYAGGSLGGTQPKVTAGVAAEYLSGDLRLRGGVDARMLLNDQSSLTYQPYAGVNYFPADSLMVGAWGRALIQPATDTALYGFGVEGGYEVLNHTWVSLGYNLRGFDGLDTAGLYTRPGAYVRLDVALDETLNGEKK